MQCLNLRRMLILFLRFLVVVTLIHSTIYLVVAGNVGKFSPTFSSFTDEYDLCSRGSTSDRTKFHEFLLSSLH